MQMASVVFSLVSIAWSLTLLYRDGRLEQEKQSISLFGSFIYLLWRVFSITGRCLALVLFTMAFDYWIAAVMLINCLLSVYIVFGIEKQRYNERWELVMILITCFMSLFASFHIWTGNSRRFYIAGYLTEFIGNFIMLSLCLRYFTFPFTLHVCIISFASSIIGIAFMLSYYSAFHPKKFSDDAHSNLGEMHDMEPALTQQLAPPPE